MRGRKRERKRDEREREMREMREMREEERDEKEDDITYRFHITYGGYIDDWKANSWFIFR